MNDPEAALDLALEQIHRAFGKDAPPWPANDLEETEDELSPEEQAAEDGRQRAWNALTKEEQEARWAAWEAENFPEGAPF